MLTEPLPNALDVRKASARGVSVSGTLKPLDLPRFKALLADETGEIRADLAFSRDEENRPVVQVKIAAEVAVICQRCLHPMQLAIEGDNMLGIVWNDDQAKHLPRHLDPLIVPEDEGCNLWELVEDELMLALPPYSYHPIEDCKETLSDYTGQGEEEEEAPARPNPFDVLAQLKSDD